MRANDPIIPTLFLLLLALPLFSIAQDKESKEPPYGSARIDGAEESGFYRLSVRPFLQKYLRPELEDLRILDAQGQEVPYLFKGRDRFEPFRVIRTLKHINQEGMKGGGVYLELEDPEPDSIEALGLEVDRSPVSRPIRILASEEGNSWETVHQERKYHDERFPDGTKRFIIRNANLGAHSHYRIELDKGVGTDPRIRTVSVIEDRSDWRHYFPLPQPAFKTMEKGDRTIIPLEFDAPTYRIHGLELALKGPDFFYRRGFIARGDPESPEKLEKLTSFDFVSYEGPQAHASASQRSKVITRSHFDGLQSKDLVLLIRDQDLPPLKVLDVKAFQRKRPVLFRSDEGRIPVKLSFGDPEAEAPGYDLPHFTEKLPQNVPEVKVENIRWEGPPLNELYPRKGGENGRETPERRILTIVGFILVWVLGIGVLVAVILLWRRGIF